jgi:hypothetical protein
MHTSWLESSVYAVLEDWNKQHHKVERLRVTAQDTEYTFMFCNTAVYHSVRFIFLGYECVWSQILKLFLRVHVHIYILMQTQIIFTFKQGQIM